MAVFTRSVTAVLLLVSSSGVYGSESQAPSDSPIPRTAEVGNPTSEMLSGNGTPQGYKLAQTVIVKGSEWVYIGLRRASRGMDYEIDYDSGALVFAEPISNNSPIRVDYRYHDAEKASSFPTMGFSPKLAPWLEITARSGCSGGILDTGAKQKDKLSVGGLDTRVKVGKGSVLTGAVYMSGPSEVKSASSALRPSFEKPAKNTIPTDRLIVQSADISTGGARFRLGYQSAGSGFTGYDRLRKMTSLPEPLISSLEKEKGLKRMDAAVDLSIPNGGQMSIAINKISDRSGEVVTKMLGLSARGFALDYAVREVKRGFSRFSDLRDIDRSQLSAESGLRRTIYGLRFIGQNRKLNSFRVSRVENQSGSMTITSVGVNLGAVQFRADTRRAGTGFNRVGGMDNDERTSLALAVRRHFDSLADATSIADPEKQGIGNEIGLDRAVYSAGFTGKGFSGIFSINEISAHRGRARSRRIDMAGKNFKLRLSRQAVELGFDRICDLQPPEKAAFGNEHGMSRNSLTGSVNLGAYTLALDSTNVNENHGPGMRRWKFNLNSSKAKAQLDFKEIDANFERILDLSDSERQQWIGLRGFGYLSWKSSYAPSGAMRLENAVNRSRNTNDGRFLIEQNHAFALNPKNGLNVNAVMESRREGMAGGEVVASSHSRISLNHTIAFMGGLKIEAQADTYMAQCPEGMLKSHFLQAHMESDQKADTSCMIDMLDSGSVDGRSESVRSAGVRSRISGNLALCGNLEVIRRSSQDYQGMFGTFGLDWALNKDLRMKLNLRNIGHGPQSGQRVRQFSLDGVLAKRLGILSDVRIGSGINTTDGCGKRIGCDNSFNLQAGVLGGSITISNSDKLVGANGIYNTSHMILYQSDPNPARPVHVKYLRQSQVNQSGAAFITREYSCDFKLGKGSRVSYINKTGWGVVGNGLAPIRNCEFKLSHSLPGSLTVNCGYANTLDGVAKTVHRSIGFGISSAVDDKAHYELHYGYDLAGSNGLLDRGNAFTIKFHKQISDVQYITLSAQKIIGAQSPTSNQGAGDPSARLDIHLNF